MAASSRQRLRPWLIAKINSKEIPGLYWIDKEQMIFRIPWKHGGKQDWSPGHSQIFMEWARHTGKYREGVDTPEWAKWKTRLRCAFNKAPDIVELKQRSDPDASDPFKVYMFKDIDRSGASRCKQKAKTQVASSAQPNMNEPVLPLFVDEAQVSRSGELPSDLRSIKSGELVPGGADINMMSTGSLASFGEVKTDVPMDTEEPVAVDPGDFPTNEATGAPIPANPHAPSPLLGITADAYPASQAASSPASSDATFELAAASPASTDNVGPYVSQASPLQGDIPGLMPAAMTPIEVLGNQESFELTERFSDLTVLQTMPNHQDTPLGRVTFQLLPNLNDTENHQLIIKAETDIPDYLQGHEMSVRVQYLSSVVLEEVVIEPKGCRLYYGSDSDIRSVTTTEQARKMIGPSDALQLHLPKSTGLLTPRQEEYAQMLLENITRGVHLECDDGDIYATRYCKCIIYYCSDSQKEGVKLIRHQRTKIFDYMKNFIPAYQEYLSTGIGDPPSAEVCLTFGQKTCYVNLSEGTLISAYILSCQAYRSIEELNQRCMNSIEMDDMQISEPDEEDQKLDFLRNGDGATL